MKCIHSFVCSSKGWAILCESILNFYQIVLIQTTINTKLSHIHLGHSLPGFLCQFLLLSRTAVSNILKCRHFIFLYLLFPVCISLNHEREERYMNVQRQKIFPQWTKLILHGLSQCKKIRKRNVLSLFCFVSLLYMDTYLCTCNIYVHVCVIKRLNNLI